jgi:hypothetical protein
MVKMASAKEKKFKEELLMVRGEVAGTKASKEGVYNPIEDPVVKGWQTRIETLQKLKKMIEECPGRDERDPMYLSPLSAERLLVGAEELYYRYMDEATMRMAMVEAAHEMIGDSASHIQKKEKKAIKTCRDELKKIQKSAKEIVVSREKDSRGFKVAGYVAEEMRQIDEVVVSAAGNEHVEHRLNKGLEMLAQFQKSFDTLIANEKGKSKYKVSDLMPLTEKNKR